MLVGWGTRQVPHAPLVLNSHAALRCAAPAHHANLAPARPQCLVLGAYTAGMLRGRGDADAIAARAEAVKGLKDFAAVAAGLTERGSRLPW